MWETIENWVHSWTTRGVIITLSVILIILGIFSGESSASEGVDPNPKYLGESKYGYHFNVHGEQWVCATQGGGKVFCLTENSKEWTCDYKEPPVYFVRCKEPIGI